MEVSEQIFRLSLAFVVLFILTRIMGRKEISQMTFFNFVSSIAIGSIAANLAVNANLSVRNGVIALVGWTAFTLLLAYVDIKFREMRKITTGEPIVVMKDGKIMENSLRATQLDIDALKTLLRQKNIFHMKDVEYAIFETSGKLSVMKYEHKQPVTKEDLHVLTKVKMYPAATQVISDGVIDVDNLSRLHVDENWLAQQLQKAGISTISEVFYAEVQPDGSLYIDKKNDDMVH